MSAFDRLDEQAQVALLDELTETHRKHHGEPTEPCRHGHFECSPTESGPCEAEAVALAVAVWNTEQPQTMADGPGAGRGTPELRLRRSYTVRLAIETPEVPATVTRQHVHAQDADHAAALAVAATERETGQTGWVLDGPVETTPPTCKCGNPVLWGSHSLAGCHHRYR